MHKYIVIWSEYHYEDDGGLIQHRDWQDCNSIAACERLISDNSQYWDTHMIMRIEPEYYNMIQSMFTPVIRSLK